MGTVATAGMPIGATPIQMEEFIATAATVDTIALATETAAIIGNRIKPHRIFS